MLQFIYSPRISIDWWMGRTHGIQTFLGQGPNLSHSSDNAGSSTAWPPGNPTQGSFPIRFSDTAKPHNNFIWKHSVTLCSILFSFRNKHFQLGKEWFLRLLSHEKKSVWGAILKVHKINGDLILMRNTKCHYEQQLWQCYTHMFYLNRKIYIYICITFSIS